MALKLFKHQTDALELLGEHDSFGLFHDMGLGKTLTMLVHLSNLALSGEIESVLWLAPKSALGAIERDFEFMEQCGVGYRVEALKPILTAMNYEKLSRRNSSWRKKVDSTRWDALVCDEAHCLARPNSNRTVYILGSGRSKGLADKIPYRYAMTGTPITNSRLEDFWSFLKMMHGETYIPFSKFEERYLKLRYFPGTYIKRRDGYKNEQELIEEVASFSQSLRKEDCLDLPEMMPDTVIRVPWASTKAEKMYRKALEEDVINCTDEVIENALVKTLRLRQLATGSIYDEDGTLVKLPNEKASYAVELIEHNPRKTVVFYEFKGSFEVLADALGRAGIPYMFLNGEQKDKNVWREFQKKTPEECRVFVAQYRSGNAGIDLYTASDTIFYEPCQSSTVLNQARSRTHRNGVSRACTYTFLLEEGTIEEDIYRKLRNHEDFNEKVWIELMRKQAVNG